jgi:hypothetical protein
MLLPTIPIALLTGVLSAAGPPAAAPLTVDLDGDGAPEQVSVLARKKKARLEIREPSGKVLAEVDVPVPRDASAGIPTVELSTGSLGSAGALLEVAASSGGAECRSVWRYRDRALARVPIAAPDVRECGRSGEWTYEWERTSEESPARYRRERTRETDLGPHHVVEAYRYAGFRMEPDPAGSRSEIRGVAIPSWYPATLYRRSALDGLYSHYDLSELKKSPRLQILADRERGVFSIRISDASGRLERTLPVTASRPGAEPNEVILTLGSAEPPVEARVALSGRSTVAGEVQLTGMGKDLDVLYTPATLFTGEALHVYARAEDALASAGLVGSWSGAKGDALTITLASNDPVLIAIAGSQFAVEVDRAPAGVDALLVPKAGGPPTSGILLRGPDSLERVAVQCDSATPLSDCRANRTGELFKRVGGRVNSR